MALAPRAELDELHRLAGVALEDVADPVGEARRVWRAALQAGGHEVLVGDARYVERAAVLVAHSRGLYLLRHVRTEVRAQALPLTGEHPVALEVAERAVVGHDLEAVAQRLEAAPGAMTPVGALAHQLGEQ